MKIKLFLTDIDGVWTDGGMYYDSLGNELKKYSTYDSAGVIFLRKLHIPTGIISGEDNLIIKKRAQKLGITILRTGIKNKLACAEALAGELGLSLSEIAYIGDDVNDAELLQKVGLSAAPASAPEYIKSRVHWVMTKKGGEGVFREFVERYLEQEGVFEKVLGQVISDLTEGGDEIQGA